MTLRHSSVAGTAFKYDLRSEDAERNQNSTVSVFTRDRDGTLRHFYPAHPWTIPRVIVMASWRPTAKFS